MPQLIPFYWLNMLSWEFIALGTALTIVSLVILPNIVRLHMARNIISHI